MSSKVESAPGGAAGHSRIEERATATIRFAGDSGDGMQLAGTQFTNTSAVFGNDVSTLPDFPAEIRAPAGTLHGVSGFQIQFSSHDIHTPGDRVDALIAMNPAALRTNLRDLVEGGILIVNTDEFTPGNLQRAKFTQNPLESGELAAYRVHAVPISAHTLTAVEPTGLGHKEAARCRNFYALGIVYWLYDRPLDTTLSWIEEKFGKKPQVAQANVLALKAGFHLAETAELFPVQYRVTAAKLPAGKYRNLTGNQALAMGLITAAQLARKPLFYASYPITPASDILHDLSRYKNYDVRTFQAEDEIAAICAALGGAYGGALAATGSSGPGIALKQEGIGLGVMTELPVVIVNVQRAGPSTGMPTKVEQTDLWQVMLGRNGECPAPVIAPQSPGDCFWAAIEASRVAMHFMTPIFVLSDGYLANSSEPWRVPKASDLKPIEVRHPAARQGNGELEPYRPYTRDERGSRPWPLPGTPGLQHRIGGLSKQHETGNISYDPDNHQLMINLRAQKVMNIAHEVEPQEVFGPDKGELLVVSWGGTYGVIRTAVRELVEKGASVAHAHVRWLHPFPSNFESVLRSYRRVLVCELNMGQLQFVIRGRFALDALGYHKVQGRPFQVHEIKQQIQRVLGGDA
jgi:2-oxoglutarate ferredoxin oxidoreductase subunit alpha